jgi:hypothetical protein
MKSRYNAFALIAILTSIPAFVSAAAGDVTLQTLAATFTSTIVQSLMGLFIASASVAFFYGVFRYIWGIREGDEERVRVGNQFMLWGMIALFVMTSAWGIVAYVQGIFSINGSSAIVIPNSNIR